MNEVRFLYTETVQSRSLVISGEGETAGKFHRNISSNSPRFEQVLAYLRDPENKDVWDADKVIGMVDAAETTMKEIEKLSERVTRKGSELFFDGDRLDNALSNHIVRMILAGDDNYKSFVAFLDNLATNPDTRARQELFGWLNSREFTITEDGYFIAYKAVRADGRSKTAGRETVLVDGVEHVGNIPNPVGATVEMPRSVVDDDKNQTCSFGLHAGTMEYVQWFGGGDDQTLVVQINPRDVVSVPADHSSSKLRVCRYKVLSVSEGEISSPTVKSSTFAPNYDLDNGDDGPDFDGDECERCGDYTGGYADLCDSCQDDEDEAATERDTISVPVDPWWSKS